MGLFSKIKLGSERYPALTGIRAMGATIVFFDHFPLSPNFHIRINVLAFFFVLSGFLIIKIYYNKAELSGKNTFSYFTNRFARIYPVYFLLLTIAILLRHDYSPLLLIKNYTLTHALVNNTKDFVIEPSWSLTVEECFYFLAPFIILIIRKINFIASLLFAFVLLGVALLVSESGTPILKTPVFVFSTTFFGHFMEFYAGVYLALIMMKKEKSGHVNLQGHVWTVAGAAGVFILIIVMGFIYVNPHPDAFGVILVNNFLMPVPIAVLYYGFMCENTLASRFLSGKVIGLLGRSSYTFYLLHTIIIQYLSLPFLLPLFGTHYILCAVFTYILTYLLSILIFRYYEEPLNIFIRQKTVAKAGQTALLSQK